MLTADEVQEAGGTDGPADAGRRRPGSSEGVGRSGLQSSACWQIRVRRWVNWASEFPQDTPHLTVVENTEEVHHLVVCTLCSCYPRMLLGRPPDWYKSLAYRSRAVSNPRGVMAEFGTEVAADIQVDVLDSTADMRYLVLPSRPDGTEGMTEDELARLVTRDSMIGVSNALAP